MEIRNMVHTIRMAGEMIDYICFRVILGKFFMSI